MFNPQLAQHLALLQDDDDGNNDDGDDLAYEANKELVPVHLPETVETDSAPVSTSHDAIMRQDKGPSKKSQRRFLPGLFENREGYAYEPLYDISAHGVVVVVTAAVVLSVVLPASPIWRGLVMGLAFVLMHYHSQTQTPPLWNGDIDDNRKSNPIILLHQQQQLQQQRQTNSRVRLSTLLGLMGAPPLSGEAEEPTVTTTTTNVVPCHSLPLTSTSLTTFLEDFAQTNADLVETVDQTMETLKRGTSLGLGLGWRTAALASVERVELAAMSRFRRRQHISAGTTSTSVVDTSSTGGSSRTTGFCLSLSRLRHTLYRLIMRQKALLLAILDDLNEGIVDDSGNEQVCSRRDPLDPVVTLALLRRGRNDLVHILGMILDRCSSFKNESLTSDTRIQSQQNLSMSIAKEARAHLLASLTLSSSSHISASSSGRDERTPFQQRVSDLHAQVDALQVALIGCHDESCVSVPKKDGSGDGGGVVTDETQAAKWWEHVSNLLDEVDATRRTVEQEFFPSSLEPASEANVEDGFDEQGATRSTEEREEFNADGQPTHHPTEQSLDAQGQRTFIFSGSGAVAPRRRRVEKSISASYEKPRPAQYDSFMEQSLMHELRSHLQAMPSTEEVNVVQMEVAECCDDDEGAQRDVKPQAASRRGVSGVASGLLVSELKASLKSLTEGEQSMQWEVQN
jgi:hypothetical protein